MMKSDISRPFSVFTRHGMTNSLPPAPSVLALGTFDGVHIAHRRLLSEAFSLKARLGAAALGVWCFEESPASFFRGETAYKLTDNEQRLALLFECGADFVIMARFEDFCTLEAEAFVNSILKNKLGCIGTVCGFNHRFGHRGAGDPALLESLFGDENTLTVPKTELSGETVSSSAIRTHLQNGNTELAALMLGRNFSLTAKVTKGKRLGRKIGFPTANQYFKGDTVSIKHGVYTTRCIFENGSILAGVSNVGIRPSIFADDDHSLNCETYIIGFDGELYGKTLTIEFCKFLRDEKKFSSLDELSAAILEDKRRTEEYFAALKNNAQNGV